MGRKPRIHFRGACYHVILRGNDRQRIFQDDFDYMRFLRLVAEGTERFDHRVHAFCLMPNHVHLAIEVSSVPLSKVAHNFGFRYAQAFNRRYGRRGHLFENRYLDGLVETDGGIMRLIRYIHLNPVRAGMTQSAADFRWASHAAYLGREDIPWLTSDRVLGLFSSAEEEARVLLSEFIERALDKERQDVDSFNQVIEEENLPDRLLTDRWNGGTARARLPDSYLMKGITIERILAVVCDCVGVGIRELRSSSQRRVLWEARAMVSHLVRRSPHLGLVQLEIPLARHVSNLSRAATRISSLRHTDSRIADLIDRIETKLGLPSSD